MGDQVIINLDSGVVEIPDNLAIHQYMQLLRLLEQAQETIYETHLDPETINLDNLSEEEAEMMASELTHMLIETARKETE